MSIISCIISRLKRDEQTDTYVHFEQTATLREIVTTIDSPYVFFYTLKNAFSKWHKPPEPSCFTLIITRNKMVRKLHTQLLTINWGASGMILISDQFFYSEQTF